MESYCDQLMKDFMFFRSGLTILSEVRKVVYKTIVSIHFLLKTTGTVKRSLKVNT